MKLHYYTNTLLKSFGWEKSPYEVQKPKFVIQLVTVPFIVGGTIAGRLSKNPLVLGI